MREEGLGERIARLEEIAEANQAEIGRARDRLHDLEKATEGLLALQKQMHRDNAARLARITVSIQWGGLLVSVVLLLLTVVTALHLHR